MNDRPSIVVPRMRRAPGDDVGSLADYPAALIEVMLERVIASNTFRRSQRHRQFLEHVIRAGLAGQRDRLKEVIIGIEVFGRMLPTYDPRRDPIVRVEAGRIRDKLARYYEAEGAGEAFQIVIPIGNYMPQFVRRRVDATGVVRSTASQALAILPFTNLSNDAEAAAFAFGLADQLIDSIGRVPGLRVVARMSALKARDAGMDLKAIGKLLGVEHVIEGSLQRSGPRTRCIAQISRTKDSVRVWSQRFEHDADRDPDLFAFQDAIAESVLTAVSSINAPQAARADGVAQAWSGLRPLTTDNHEARDLFERARSLSQLRTFEGYSRAVTLLERAIALDSSFAQAYSLLGGVYANRGGFNMEPTFPTFAKVEWAARRALELDPLDGEARALLATIAYRIEYRWSEADALFQEALRLAPNSTVVHSAYAWALVFNGQADDALRHAKLSENLDPLNLGLRANNAAIAMHALQFDQAIQAFLSIIQVEPDHFFSRIVGGITLVAMGQPDAALAHIDHVVRLTPSYATPRFSRICALGARGDVAVAKRELGDLMTEIGDRHFSRMNLAMAQLCLADVDGAMQSLTQAAETRDLLFPAALVHPLFAPARADERFGALLSRFGLTPTIRATLASPTGR